MATGRRPFQGDTAISTISSILKHTPPPPQQVNPSLPSHLGRIVRRYLAKEPERRYQSTDDLRNELRELKEETESGELSLAEGAASGAPATETRKRSAVIGLLAAAAALVAAAGGWLWLRREASPAMALASLASIQMSRATTDGKVQEAAISPDGRYVAYARREGAMFSLRLRQLVTGDEVQVVAPSEAFLTSLSFSADGDFLHYVSIERGRSSGWVHQVSVLGGTPRRIVDGARDVAVSPDGRQLVIRGGTPERSHVRIVGSDGDAPRDVALREGRDHFDGGVKWSSDGRSLAIISHRYGEPQQIFLIDPASGQEQALPIPSLRSISDLNWIPGKDALVVAGSDRPFQQPAPSQIWEVSTNGELRPLTRDLNDYSNLTVTADGSTVAAVQVEYRSGIDVATVRDGVPGAFTELFPISAARAGQGIAWLGSDRLAHGMMQAEALQVFVTDVTSRSSRALTTGPSHQDLAVSRDGRSLVVVRDDGVRSNLWRVDPETGRGQRLTDGEFDASPVLSADGTWVVYTSAGDTFKLLKIPGTGGTPVELAQQRSWCVDISADNREALCRVFAPSGESERMMVPLAGGEPRPIPGIPAAARMARFGPDGRSIHYLISHEGADELWGFPAQGGPPRKLVRFEGKEVGDFAWSPDGRRLAVVKFSRSGDVVLLKRALAADRTRTE
jgi:Tol biopolymer transport system component